MYFRFGWYQIKKNGGLFLFLFIQLSAVLLLLVAACSVISHNMADYRKFADYFEREGWLVRGVLWDEDRVPCTKEKLAAGLNKAEVLCTYSSSFRIEDVEENLTLLYDREMAGRHRPELSSGKWLDELPEGDGSALHVVVSKNTGLSTGEETTGYFWKKDGGTVSFPVVVAGVLSAGTEVVGELWDNFSYYETYEDIYSRTDGESHGIVLASAEELACVAPQCGIENPDICMEGVILVRYARDITAEEAAENERILKGLDGVIDYRVPFSDIRKNSKAAVKNRLSFFFPVAGCVLVLLLVSCVSVQTAVFEREEKRYGIYRLCGLERSGIYRINLASACMLSAAAFCIVCVLLAAVLAGRQVLDTTITFGKPELAACLAAVMLYAACSAAVPAVRLQRQKIMGG